MSEWWRIYKYIPSYKIVLSFIETLNLYTSLSDFPDWCALQLPFSTSENQAAIEFMHVHLLKLNCCQLDIPLISLYSKKGSELVPFSPLKKRVNKRGSKRETLRLLPGKTGFSPEAGSFNHWVINPGWWLGIIACHSSNSSFKWAIRLLPRLQVEMLHLIKSSQTSKRE